MSDWKRKWAYNLASKIDTIYKNAETFIQAEDKVRVLLLANIPQPPEDKTNA